MKEIVRTLEHAQKIVVIQAENPDGDSLGSALALEAILSDQGKEVVLQCSVDMPKYLRYVSGWDRVQRDLPRQFDAAVIVDASTRPVLERLLTPPNIAMLSQRPLIIIDHHSTPADLPLKTINLTDATAVATGQLIFKLAKTGEWQVAKDAATCIAISIMSDSLGLSSPKTTAETVHILAECVESGASLSAINEQRRAFSKKTPDIFYYKGRLFERVELLLDNRLGLVVIPWEEIEEYSDAYNPSVLIMDEMRMIEGVEVAAAFKTYPDGKITAKLTANSGGQFMDELAEHFGGGGHAFAAGFKVHGMPFETLKKEFIQEVKALLESST